ncbi:hypothetical protein EVAR_67893_1 [Eumeta japonica]|uniref:Uncharacterized protein n=1 Tax=Eumeta variegata TaxID=151549 RepID=A0A4C1YSV7_EUMVA|nr:hypothetical protein EVAR_67893_1 [Eumeta japonica]
MARRSGAARACALIVRVGKGEGCNVTRCTALFRGLIHAPIYRTGPDYGTVHINSFCKLMGSDHKPTSLAQCGLGSAFGCQCAPYAHEHILPQSKGTNEEKLSLLLPELFHAIFEHYLFNAAILKSINFDNT